jgi:hypothetical protein
MPCERQRLIFDFSRITSKRGSATPLVKTRLTQPTSHQGKRAAFCRGEVVMRHGGGMAGLLSQRWWISYVRVAYSNGSRSMCAKQQRRSISLNDAMTPDHKSGNY